MKMMHILTEKLLKTDFNKYTYFLKGTKDFRSRVCLNQVNRNKQVNTVFVHCKDLKSLVSEIMT
ncbi:hypothetical protein CBW16_07710 [Flavobacteriaceae bacterium JJC]|nr:hypothetical protein CBW16_07710 [Flavobacteriaceae bacterium JJC]